LAVAAGGLAGLALAAAPAQAAVISTAHTVIPEFRESNPKFGTTFLPAYTKYVLAIAATPGESNALAIESAPGAIVVRDSAGVAPGDGCELADATTAVCPTPAAQGTTDVKWEIGRIDLADGDDSIRVPLGGLSSNQGEVDGGGGNDTIEGARRAFGGPGDDRLDAQIADGGPGNDQITAREADGGDGHDVLSPHREDMAVKLRGGPGDDVLTGAPLPGDVLDGGDGDDRLAARDGDDELLPGPGADVIDGGPGIDHVSFAYATAAVSADLAAPGPSDPTGEGDAMTAVESVAGGGGDDVLLGSDGDSLLVGGEGDDRLDGRGGRDVIVGGLGTDAIDGGPGNDDLATGSAVVQIVSRTYSQDAPDAVPDVATGGDGRDILRIGSLDRGDGGPGNDLFVAAGRPASARCGSGGHDRFDGGQLPRDCERIMWFGVESTAARLTLRRSIVAIELPGHFGGRVTVQLRAAGRLVARGSTRIAFDARRTLRLRVSPRRRLALRRARTVRVDVIAPGPSDGRVRDRALLPPPR